MTKRENFNALIDIATANGKDELVTFLKHEIELLDKKSASSGNSKAKAESDARAEKLFAALSEMEEPVTFAELKTLTSDEEVKDWTPQRLSALVRKLGDRVTKEMRGKTAYFSVA